MIYYWHKLINLKNKQLKFTNPWMNETLFPPIMPILLTSQCSSLFCHMYSCLVKSAILAKLSEFKGNGCNITAGQNNEFKIGMENVECHLLVLCRYNVGMFASTGTFILRSFVKTFSIIPLNQIWKSLSMPHAFWWILNDVSLQLNFRQYCTSNRKPLS